jgi:hypothetical protein
LSGRKPVRLPHFAYMREDFKCGVLVRNNNLNIVWFDLLTPL